MARIEAEMALTRDVRLKATCLHILICALYVHVTLHEFGVRIQQVKRKRKNKTREKKKKKKKKKRPKGVPPDTGPKIDFLHEMLPEIVTKMTPKNQILSHRQNKGGR